MLFIITDTTDGMVGNQTTIEGFVLESGNTPGANDGIGIVTLRVEDYAIRHNIFDEGFLIAIDSRAASGEISKNYMSNIGLCAMCIQGPGTVDILSNRALDGYGGLFLSPTVQHYPFKLGVQGRKLSVKPFEVPSVAHLDGAITNNDLSGHTIDPNFSFGLRLLMYGPGTASHVTEQSLSYIISDNTMQNNAFGVHIDAGFPERNDLTPVGDFVGTFSNNDVSGNCRTPLLVTFTRFTASLFPDQLIARPYLQDSTYEITFAEGDEDVFAGRWIDHPTNDPVDGRELNNVLLENGETIAPGTRIVPFDPEDPGPCVFD